MRKAAETVSAIIADGIVPAAMEAMDQKTIEVIEQHIPAGYPTNAGAVLLVEVEGLADGVEIDALRIGEIAETHEADDIKIAQTSYQRDALWKGRKSAFGASTYLAPNYYLHDTVVPRSELANVLDKVNQLAEENDLTIMNVFMLEMETYTRYLSLMLMRKEHLTASIKSQQKLSKFLLKLGEFYRVNMESE